MAKKRVILSSLAMRFHETCGWTLAELEDMLLHRGRAGGFAEMSCDNHPELGRYWILEVGSKIDVGRLAEVAYADGKKDYTETQRLSDREAFATRNW